MRKNIFLLCFLSLMVLLVSCSASDSSGEVSTDEAEFVLRLPHIVSTDNPAHIAALDFQEEVEEESDGRIEVQIFPNGELYDSDRELIEALQLNNIEISLVGAPSLGNFDERFYVLDLPFLFEDREAPRQALAGELGEELSNGLEDINLKVLGYGYDGFRHVLNSQHPIETLEDMNGLQLRVQESEIQEEMFNALGANASPLAYGELYSALQQNVYDGMDSPLGLVDSGLFYEVQDYLSLTYHQYSGLIFLMSQERFNQLPEDLQDIVVTAAADMEDNYYDLVDEAEDTIRQEMEDDNLIEINEISKGERQRLIEAVQPVYDQFAEIVGEDLVDMAKNTDE
ncbi:TRAP transporter substrate-binding protein [Virgibacillus sp. NKC19-3]|uniref:TRAP transporter substrate-binding protein n=1 Tax=Virgibacillus saliphilus TaxID=2831674 RepID=UPI001C9A3EA1|nr:TRAP transporter substrate-binding protein [Virgibacillus sp. NKC19-3]MBY7144518.1 TRAP transporter substrate-binding protein [Virgibacillus sp. NKC19-3]